MKQFTAAAVLVTLSAATLADPVTYIVDSNHTLPRFEYNHLGFSTQVGRFDKATGKIVLDLAAKTGSADIVIDATSVNTGSAKFDEHIQSEDFLDTAKYPTITFKGERFKFQGDKPAKVEGQLTIKGVTKPVTLTVTTFNCGLHPMAKKEACGANAFTSIKRSEFNAGKYAPMVSDQVTLNIPVEAIKE